MGRQPPSLSVACAAVDRDRLVERTMRLVSIPSPSGQEQMVADAYASLLCKAGLEVSIDDQYPESPSVIGRLTGEVGRPVLQLAGHLDTVSTPHREPYLGEGVIVGRGACDMKGGLAAIVEVVTVLSQLEVDLGGSLLVTAHGQHEEAVNGRTLHAPLLGLLQRGIVGDACLIPEGPHRELPLTGRGLVIFRCVFWREGEPVHEVLSGPDHPPNPLTACHGFVSLLEEASKDWSLVDHLAGPESYFIGSITGGDYYNRIPNEAAVWGTRRYPVGRSFESARSELVEISEKAANAIGCRVRLELQKSGQPFAISPDEPLVQALQSSHRSVEGDDLPFAGMTYSADGSQFINVGGIPALYHGTDSSTAHGNVELVKVDDLVRCARVLLGAVCNYLGPALI
jgi:acetylornithine deacetylase/succinyl-diaminopimelate desuccinylase-like protein